jgi:GrpB-like predicted nucleotidyltransferase (UPF0157 family)
VLGTPVELVPHSPDWADAARAESARLAGAFGGNLVAVHHVGSTAIPGIRAKPILDLMPELRSLAHLDAARAALEALGYAWRGEFDIPGRRYLTLDDPATARRRVQLHCFESAHPEVEWLLAFRDYLRAHPDKAREYEAEKLRARDLHPTNVRDYTAAKAPWIEALRPLAMAQRGASVTRDAAARRF